MPLDTSIYGETKLFQPNTPTQTAAQLGVFQEVAQHIKEQKQQELDQTAMQQAVAQTGGDYEKAIASLNRAGQVTAAQSLQGAWDKHQEAAGKALEAHLKAQDAQLGYYSHLANLISDDASQKAVLATLSPEDQQRVSPLLGPTYDAQRVGSIRDVMLDGQKRAQIQHEALQDWRESGKTVQDGVTTLSKYLSATPQAQWGQVIGSASTLGIPSASVDFVRQNVTTPEQADALANKKEATEKGGQHVEGMYHGKRTFGVFDPNTNTYNVDGKSVSAAEFTPIPPASLIIHNQTAAADAKSGGAVGAANQDVKYWADQIIKDPTMATNPLISGKMNQGLRTAIAHEIASRGGSLDKMTAQTKQMGETAKAILPHISTIEQEAKDLEARGLMGPIGSRWREFINGTLRAGAITTNPDDAKLMGRFQADLGLLRSAVARAHGGARGGGSPTMIEHMKTIIQGGGDLPTFLGSTAAVRDWMQTYADEAKQDTGTKLTTGTTVKIGKYLVTPK